MYLIVIWVMGLISMLVLYFLHAYTTLFLSLICHGHTRNRIVLSYDHWQQVHSLTLRSPGAWDRRLDLDQWEV